jgi:hypothetical protein
MCCTAVLEVPENGPADEVVGSVEVVEDFSNIKYIPREFV